MQTTQVAYGTAAQPPTPIEIANQNGAPIRSIRVDNYSPAWYSSSTLNIFIPPFTIGWTALYNPPTARDILRKGAPSGYVQQALPPNVPTQIVVTVADDDSLYAYGAPYGAQLGPKIGSANQPIQEVAVFGIAGTIVDLPVINGSLPFTTSISGTVTVSGTVSISGTVTVSGTVSITLSATGTETSVAASASSVSILASNASRLGFVLVNDSTSAVFVRFNSGAASTTTYTYRMAGSNANGDLATLEVWGYTGAITAIWSSATGNMRITELT